MKNIRQSKELKSILFILFMSTFQPYFDIFLMLQYGPASSCLECFILEQTFYISMLCISVPLIVLYIPLKIISWDSSLKYAIIGISFALLSFYNLTLLLFRERVALWSTFSEEELFINALMGGFPTLLIQVVLITKVLHKINLKVTIL